MKEKLRKKRTLILMVGLLLIFVVITIQAKKIEKENTKEETVMSMEDEYYYYDEYGNKYFKGNNELGYEDVIFSYVKSLALLDFSTALTYTFNSSSKIIQGYEGINYNSNRSLGDSAMYSFRSKMYKKVITSLIIEEIVDTVLMPNKYIVTMRVSHLDLNNEDFWEKDREKIFDRLLTYNSEEDVSGVQSKVIDYLSQYIQKEYSKEDAPVKTTEIEITVTKNAYGSWFVSDDTDLFVLCSNNDGTYPITKIQEEFGEWYKAYLEEKYNSNKTIVAE